MLEDHQSPWIAYVDVFQIAPRPDTTGDIETQLIRYEEGRAFTAHVDFYEKSQDFCNICDLNAPVGAGDGSGNSMVSGGENLLLSSAGTLG